MKIIQKIHSYLYILDSNSFYKNVAIFIGINIGIFLAILYFSISSIYASKKTLQEIQKKDVEAQMLINRLEKVKKQSEEINTILQQEPSFRIKNFYDDILRKLKLETNQKRDADVSEEDVLKGKYTEIRLTSYLNGLDMRQLCDLLQALEEKSRIYMKELVITKKQYSLIDITLTIATLTAEFNESKSA